METAPPVSPAPYALQPIALVPATSARQTRREADRDRSRILETAREVFAVYGLDVTLADIASFAGLSVQTVQRAFPSRDGLIESLFDEALTELADAADTATEHPDPLLGFLDFLSESGRVQSRNSGLRMLLQGESTSERAAATAEARLLPALNRLVERARASEVVPSQMSPADLPALQFVMSNLNEYAENVEPELWQRYLAILLDGLQSEPLDCDLALPGSGPRALN
ncbi:TetR/AcrR family transcriptional regulator [Cryptosporangium phraense]|uniref:TetR/AcrR family transcriptional regulator n=1 Tax=Cryptosporangium phraense TaxID=2593070 RepID=A0A545AXA7_9ACTN|nr:TetR/AcrR family transcriptional regulator [Cryptosporangium phraense]TQS45966.1 TetR/AcrR family transcriptional regulator [Cryptosporangium phraense]